MIEMDPATIDFDMACQMTGYWFGILEDGKRLTYKSDHFPKIIDFDQLAKIKPPKGYGIKQYDRDITIETSTFRGTCVEAVHYYCQLRFSGPSITQGENSICGHIPGVKKVGRIMGYQRMDLYRPVNEDDLKQTHSDWTGYSVGDMTHRWSTEKEAVDAALRVIPLRFRNYGKVYVDDEEGYHEVAVLG